MYLARTFVRPGLTRKVDAVRFSFLVGVTLALSMNVVPSLAAQNSSDLRLVTINKLIETTPAEGFTARAFYYLFVGRTEEALADFDKAKAVKPGDSSLQYNRAWALQFIGRYSEAEAILLSLSNSSLGAQDLASFYESQGNYEAALRQWDKAGESRITDKFGKAKILFQLGRFGEADAICTNLKLNGAWDYVERAKYWDQRGEPDKALADLDQAVNLDSNKLDERADFHYRHGNASMARIDFDKLVSHMTSSNFVKRSRFLEQIGDLKLAESDLNSAVNVAENQNSKQWSLAQRARFYCRNNRYADALVDINKAMTGSYQFDWCLVKGDALEGLNQRTEALKAYQDVLPFEKKMRPATMGTILRVITSTSLKTVADAYGGIGNRGKQIQYLDRRCYFEPFNVEFLYDLGLAYKQAGNIEKARGTVERCLVMLSQRKDPSTIREKCSGLFLVVGGSAKQLVALQRGGKEHRGLSAPMAKKTASILVRKSSDRETTESPQGAPTSIVQTTRGNESSKLDPAGQSEATYKIGDSIHSLPIMDARAKGAISGPDIVPVQARTTPFSVPVTPGTAPRSSKLLMVASVPSIPLPLQDVAAVQNSTPLSAAGLQQALSTRSSGSAPSVVPRDEASSSVTSGGTPIQDKWALIIGISDFLDPGIKRLSYAAKDAQDFRNFLVSEAGFSSDHVKLLLNKDATFRNIRSAFGNKWLPALVKPGDLVVVYISTHGTPAHKDHAGKNFVVAYDTEKDDLYSTAVEMDEIAERIRDGVKTDRVLIVLDTCYSGGAATSAKSTENGDSFDAREIAQSMGAGRLVISSSSPNQQSWESRNHTNGVFTRYFLNALRQKSTLVDVRQAFDSIKDAVQWEVQRDHGGAQQTPMIAGEWTGGELILSAKAARPRSMVGAPQLEQLKPLLKPAAGASKH